MESQHEEQSHRLSAYSLQSEYEYPRSDYHEPSSRNRCEESDNTKKKKKHRKKYPNPKRQHHDSLIPWMDTNTMKNFSKFFFIGFIWVSTHDPKYRENPLENKGFWILLRDDCSLDDLDLLCWSIVAIGLACFDSIDYIHTSNHMTEYGMLAIEERCIRWMLEKSKVKAIKIPRILGILLSWSWNINCIDYSKYNFSRLLRWSSINI